MLRRKERSIYERASTRHMTAKRQALASRNPEFQYTLIITSTSISSLRSITRSISVRDLILTLIIRLFDILRVYRDISLDPLTLLTKANFLKF